MRPAVFNDKMITVLEKTGANKNQELVIQDIEARSACILGARPEREPPQRRA